MKKPFCFVAMLTLIVAGQPLSLLAQNPDTDGATYYLDVHELEPGSVAYKDVVEAHKADLKTQGKYGVSFINFWVDEEKGYVYCLSMAEDPDHVHATHEEAHGLVPSTIYEVIEGEAANYKGNGFLFLDIHEVEPGSVTAEAVAEAHKKDLETQGAHDVNFINYWVDVENGKIFCLSEAPSADAVKKTHEHAHGLVPGTVLRVVQGE